MNVDIRRGYYILVLRTMETTGYEKGDDFSRELPVVSSPKHSLAFQLGICDEKGLLLYSASELEMIVNMENL